MTEPLEDPRPVQLTPTERLHNSLVDFSGCVGNAVQGICSFGLTFGEQYTPFVPDDDDEDCDEDEPGASVDCSQVWVRVMGINPKPGAQMSFGGQDCSQELVIDLEVGVIRCFAIPEGGEAPQTTEALNQALQAMEDMQDILCAALECEVWESITPGAWSPLGPLGGQTGGVWTFSVEPL